MSWSDLGAGGILLIYYSCLIQVYKMLVMNSYTVVQYSGNLRVMSTLISDTELKGPPPEARFNGNTCMCTKNSFKVG